MKKKIFSFLLLSLTTIICAYGYNNVWECQQVADWTKLSAKTYNISFSITPEMGGVVYASKKSVTAGSSITLTAVGTNHFKLQKWTCADTIVSTSSVFTYIMPAEDVELTAVFVYSPDAPDDPYDDQTLSTIHRLYVTSEPVGSCTFNMESGTRLIEGQQETICATPNMNFHFVCWKQDDKVVSTQQSYNFVMGKTDATLVAQCEYAPSDPEDPSQNYWNVATGELIMDCFTSGSLLNAIKDKVGNQISMVKSLIVSGNIQDNDVAAAKSLENCSVLDLSRTHGFNTVPNYAYNGHASLTSVVLPECVSTIGSYAFNQVQSLQSVVCMAVTPPEMGVDAFPTRTGLTVYVPYSSLALYKATVGWNIFDVQPLQDEVADLTVLLPTNIDGKYRNMTLELSNTELGITRRYVVTNAMSYTFRSLLRNSLYDIYLKNADGTVLGQLRNVELLNEDKSVTMQHLLDICTLTVKVMAENDDVSDRVTINWYDTAGNYIAQGVSLSGIVEGTNLTYKIVLPQDLAMIYILPEQIEYEVTKSASIDEELTAIGRLTIKGKVKDSATGDPLVGAVITATQKLNGLYYKSMSAKTDALGQYSIIAYDEKDISIVLSADGYVGVTMTRDDLVEDTDFGTTMLKPLIGAVLNITASYCSASASGTENRIVLDNTSNLTFSLYNETKNKIISEFTLRYPKLIITEDVSIGDRIRLIAKILTGQYDDVQTTAVISREMTSTADICFIQRGGFTATYANTDNVAVVGMLYDASGQMMNKYSYVAQTLSVKELKDGNYTLLTMAKSNFFNDISTLRALNESPLQAVTDYCINQFEINNGVITSVHNQSVPFLDESKFVNSELTTAFLVNKSTVTVGNYITLKGYVEINEKYAAYVSNAKMVIDLPEGCEFVEGSAMVGSLSVSVMPDNNRLILPMNSVTDMVKLCVKPVAAGAYTMSAYVHFVVNGTEMMQVLGSAKFTANDLTISTPTSVSRTTFTVTGTAPARSEVSVYDDDYMIGQTTSLANGMWSAEVTLIEPEDKTMHSIWAKTVTSDNEIVQSTRSSVLYEKNYVDVSDVKILYNNTDMACSYELNFNFISPDIKTQSYVYCPSNRKFTFAVNFIDNQRVKQAVVFVKTGNGSVTCLDAEYVASKNIWVAEGEFGNMYDGDTPVNVDVMSSTTEDTLNIKVEEHVFLCPDAVIIIDPSGYVYEAVQSNRVEGVRTTAFYKESKKDEHGNIKEVEILWDATAYAQENPLFTDANGMYRWDVPAGLWRVKYEKDGYVTTYSDWLPVPPPQLEVNVPIVSNVAPRVKSAVAYEDGVEVQFSTYMNTASVSTSDISLCQNGNKIAGTVTMVDATEGDDGIYATRMRFIKNADMNIVTTSPVTLTIAKRVSSYAGIPMDADYVQDFVITKAVKNIEVSPVVNVLYGQTKSIQISTVPYDAAIGKIVRVKCSSDLIASVVGEAVVQPDGNAFVMVTGELPGSATLFFSIDDTNVEAQSVVDVTRIIKKVDAPVATKATGSMLYYGSRVVLSSTTDNAVIYYTTDGSIPTISTAHVYTKPIVITGNVILKAIATADGYDEDSDMSIYEYSIRRSAIGLHMESGWNWISHNLNNEIKTSDIQDVRRIISQGGGSVENLSVAECYKVLVDSDKDIALEGLELNAAEFYVTLQAGKNWIGFPVNQSLTPNEAFLYAHPSVGDCLVGQDGFVEFLNNGWSGTLSKLDPGKGYIYYAKSPMTFCYNTAITSNANERFMGREKPAVSPSVNPYSYPNVMCITSDVYCDDVIVNTDGYDLVALSNGECRGMAKVVDGKFMMNIYGDSGENITFYLVKKNSEERLDLNESLMFAEDIVGSRLHPYMLRVAQSSEIIDCKAASASTREDQQTSFNLAGQRVGVEYRGITIMNGNKVLR